MNVKCATKRLPVDPASVRVAREAVRTWATDAEATPALIDALLLVTSELVANAVQAADDLVIVRLTMGDLARLEVDDDGTGWPTIREASEQGGFGLRIVGGLADQCGWISHTGYKTVFAELSVSRNDAE